MSYTEKLRPGDEVEVKTPHEILQTLDPDGTLDQLPFMPEMLEFCGMRFRIANRVLKTCCYTGSGTNIRTFRADDVVTLAGLRCSGGAHDSCPKGCLIFWREAWLRRVSAEDAPSMVGSNGYNALRTRLKTSSGSQTFFCQASEILKATEPLMRKERLLKCVSEVRAGNCSAIEMMHRIAIWLFWRIRRLLLGEYARGTKKSTPSASLNLRAGDWIEVLPMSKIVETLNAKGHNRGLYFSPDLRLLCGTRQRVARRLDKIIVDGTGDVRPMQDTVYLEGSHCRCPYVAFGGCPRSEFAYWREIWLRRPGAIDSKI